MTGLAATCDAAVAKRFGLARKSPKRTLHHATDKPNPCQALIGISLFRHTAAFGISYHALLIALRRL
jgi:hypothetical protein